MPLTLRDSLEPLTLRDSARYSQNQGDFADYLEASDTNPISRGWTSVSEGLAGSDLLAQANAAERAGDINLSQALELQAMDRMRRAQTWAPTTQSVRDIDGLGSAMEWVGGHVGGGARSMLAPLAGGVGGRVLGGLAGGLIAGPGGAAIGANLGSAAGAFVPSYDMQYNESVGQSMMDPEIRASRSAQDIHRTGQAVGAAGGVLDAIAPAGIGKTAVGGLGKRTIGGVLAREAGEEALTEGAQSLVGQTGQNQLAGRNLTDYGYMDALDAAAAGAVGGAGISAGGAMVGAARDKLMAGGEKVVETARDPLGAIIQKGYELADKAGRKQARDEIAAGNTPQPLRTMYEEAAAQNADERIFQPPTKDEANEMITSRMREDANRWADRILSAQPRALSPRESELREAAAQFKSDGDWSKLRTVLRKNKLIEERESMMASFDAPGTKASEMTPEGKELDTLSQVWLQNEGKRYGEYFDDSNEAKGLGAKLFAWIKNDFGKSMTEDGEIFIPRAFVDALGERAPGVIESAITAARKEGWAIKDAGDAVSAVKEYVSSNEGDVGALKSAIRYTQEKNWTDKMVQRFAKELRQKNGQLDKDDYKWLKTQVVDPTALLKHFQKPSRFYKAEKNMGVKGDTSLTQAARDQDEKAGITDNDAEWGSGVSEIDPHATRVYPKAGDVEFFDIREADQRAALEKLEKAEAAKGKGSAVLRPVKVGIVDRTLEKIAEERGVSVEALPKQTRDKVMRDLVHEYFPTFERLPAEPKNVNEFTKQQYEKRKAEYAQGLKRRANLLNQKLVALGVDQVAMEKLGTQIEARDVHMKNADPRDPKYGAARGTLILRTYNKEGKPAARPFVTSTQMIVAKMFRAKDSNGASTKRYEGSAQEILQLLSDGVTSVLQDKRFGGEGKAMKIGTLKNGEAQWFDGADIRSWPKNLVIFRGKDNRPYTLGDAIEQEKAQSANTVSFDFDPDDVLAGRNDRVRDKTPWEKRQELKEFLSNGADKPTRAKIVQALRAKGEDGKANNEPVEFLWNELVESGTLKSADVVTEVGTTRGDVLAEGQVGPDDLSAYDPDYIKRDERGDMLSSSTEYSAQSRIGTSKKVDPKDAAKFAPATKTTPDRAEDKTKATKREEMRQEFISLLRDGISKFKEAVSKMTKDDIAMLDGAYNEFKKQLSDYPHTIAKGYFGGNVDSARMLVSRFKKNMEQIDAAISNRRSEVVNAKGRVERDQVETPGGTIQADSGGKAAGSVGRDTGVTGESRPVTRTGLRGGALGADRPESGTSPAGQQVSAETDAPAKNNRPGVTTGVSPELEVSKSSQVTKNSEQTTQDFKPIDAEKALEDIARMLGKDFDAKVVKKLGGKAGTWKPGIIKLATSAAEGTQFHEALHELFYKMRTNGAANVAQLVERVANSPLIKRKLEQLLSDHPKAIKQLDTPEEAAAYLFQFWNMGLINVGPETKSLFQTIKGLVIDAAKEIHSWINAAKRDERNAEKAAKMEQDEVRRLFEALAGGAAADPTTRTQLYDALRKNVEAHTKAIDELGQRVEGFWQGIGRYVVTSESMLNLYSKHPELKTVADKFHQMAGKSMKNQARDSSLMARGGLIEAKHLEVQRRLNPFERFLMDGKYDEKDIALAAKHLEANTKSADKKINALIDYVHKYYGEMYDYMVQSDVRRLDPNSEERWVPIQKRKDYFTQSWSIEELTKDHDGFVSTLLDKHKRELEHMAQQANAEIAAWKKDKKAEVNSPSAQAEINKEGGPSQDITPEAIAEQIYVRLLNSTGMVDIQETNWSLGLTPAAGAVNRRELDWLDKEAFSKYKSKDLVEIVTNYTRTMVSRAEYQKRFGYGGEVIGEAMDTAFLREMGGQALVDKARAELDGEIKRWKKEARAWHKENPGVPFAEPYPTLRLVGVQAHRSQVGAEESNQAMIKAEKTLRPAVNAVRALEGTLGNDISPAMRNVNSWINTYQNVRLLPLALFTNFSDVIGITTNGGTLGDAWNAFTAGMREVRNTWLNEKGSDTATLRAEEWGVSDAGAMLDTLGQNYSSVYMTEKARNINNKFFRIIGMEGWNRGVRITATAVGERIIGDWIKNGVDAKKPGEKARFERLFGEGADPKKIKLDADGNLDTQDAANRAAIQRFVQDSVMSSNSAVRAIWMSDPRMATFAHLKNFAYAFHSVMLKGILAQAAEGNLRPALVAGLGFASISIAAAAVKEMLIPGDEPYWMKGGLDGYLEYGYNMANLGGVPQMYLESVTDFDPAKLAGPFWDQIQNTLSSPIPGFSINFSPVDGETEILRDRKVAVELAKALPAGNLAGRAMDSLVGE